MAGGGELPKTTLDKTKSSSLKVTIIGCDVIVLCLACWSLSWLLNVTSIIINIVLILYSGACTYGTWTDKPSLVRANIGLFGLYALLNLIIAVLALVGTDWWQGGISFVFVAFGAFGVWVTRRYLATM